MIAPKHPNDLTADPGEAETASPRRWRLNCRI
jgi:hypothetical protein